MRVVTKIYLKNHDPSDPLVIFHTQPMQPLFADMIMIQDEDGHVHTIPVASILRIFTKENK